ncbi:MAG: formate dehydrogenase accessory sulfurtransferase FdhD [Bacteroidetes bacterium]|nr:formate dehydrogenase accessory sulfurtransferase FdhD [Bacteroidota bacterium]
MQSVQLIKFNINQFENIEDVVAEEVDFTIHINNGHTLKLICTPEALKEILIGHLFTSGYINHISDMLEYTIDEINLTSNVKIAANIKSISYKKADYTIKASQILVWMDKFTHYSEKFQQTGCFHSAAIVENNDISIFYDDIGRHNAIDKIIGRMMLENKALEDKILLTTGRMPMEIMKKIHRAGIKTIISKAPPTYQSVLLGKKENITIIGFARKDKMNIYSGENRIIL